MTAEIFLQGNLIKTLKSLSNEIRGESWKFRLLALLFSNGFSGSTVFEAHLNWSDVTKQITGRAKASDGLSVPSFKGIRFFDAIPTASISKLILQITRTVN